MIQGDITYILAFGQKTKGSFKNTFQTLFRLCLKVSDFIMKRLTNTFLSTKNRFNFLINTIFQFVRLWWI